MVSRKVQCSGGLSFLQYCSLLGRHDGEIVKYFPFHISQHVTDWYGTLANEIKTNFNELREAFFQRYHKSNIEYTLTDIKQGQTETRTTISTE